MFEVLNLELLILCQGLEYVLRYYIFWGFPRYVPCPW